MSKSRERTAMNDLGHLLTAMVTPFKSEEEVDYVCAGELAKRLRANGSTGLILAGTTGEKPTMSDEEEFELYDAVLDAVGPSYPIAFNAGTNSTKHTLGFTEAVMEKYSDRIDAVMAVYPYYNKPESEGAYQHFKKIADLVAPTPFITYSVQGRTAGDVTLDTMMRIVTSCENARIIKEASGNVPRVMELIRRLRKERPEVDVYSGDDKLTFPLVALGCKGVISVASHIVGPQMKRMINAIENGYMDTARSIHYDLMPVYDATFCTTSPIPVKYALERMGFPVGDPRLPLVPLRDIDGGRLIPVVDNALKDAGLLAA